jgi:hypothetical protein
VIGASTAIFGAVWAQAQLRKSLPSAGARVTDAELAIGAAPLTTPSCPPACCAIPTSRPAHATASPHSSMRSLSAR